jgi:hypothetical protein
MRQLINLKILMLLLILASCQKLKPESVAIPEYPDFKELMKVQIELLGKKSIKKEVWLEGQSETKTLEMDSTTWAKELSFLEEVNPNQPEYVGAFEKEKEDEKEILSLGAAERGAIKKVSFSKENDAFETIQISFHEDKDVYVHHREIEMNFKDGVLSTLKIDGYQKMMLKDTVRFRVNVAVN